MAEDKSTALTPFQRRIVYSALTAVGVVVLVSIFLLCFYVLRMFVSTFSGVLWPLATAGILAMLLRPVVDLLQSKLKIKHVYAICVLYLIIILLMAGLGYLVFDMFNEQVIVFFTTLPEQIKALVTSFETKFPQINALGERLLGADEWQQLLQNASDWAKQGVAYLLPLLRESGQGIMSFFGMATQVAIIPVYLFFLLLSNRDYSLDIKSELSFLGDELRDDVVFLIRNFVGIIVSFFRGQLVIGLIMGVFYAVGFGLVGLKFGILIGLAMGFLNIVPYLGTILGLSTALPVAYLQDGGGVTTLVLVLVVFAVVQALEGYYLTPKIMGQQTGLHPMVIIIAIFFWGTALNGILGMILAIPLTAFFVVLWRLLAQKYLPRLTDKQKEGERESPQPT
ncbi:MAG: AI-2E family transporter [Verrucomicrobiota bacterium]